MGSLFVTTTLSHRPTLHAEEPLLLGRLLITGPEPRGEDDV